MIKYSLLEYTFYFFSLIIGIMISFFIGISIGIKQGRDVRSVLAKRIYILRQYIKKRLKLTDIQINNLYKE